MESKWFSAELLGEGVLKEECLEESRCKEKNNLWKRGVKEISHSKCERTAANQKK